MAVDLTSVASGGGDSGDAKGAIIESAGEAAGSAIGAIIGGGPGAAIGGAIGKTIGRIFGRKKKKGGGPQKTIVSISAFPCPKVDDKGISRAWWWADKIAQGVSLWATYETYKSAREEYKIAKRYHELAKEQWDLHRELYHPLEQQELDEIWAEKPYEPDYKTAVTGHTHLMDNVLASAERHRQRLADKYCICPDVSVFTKAQLMQATVQGDSANFARRYAEKLAQERNDLRWNRRLSAVSRGRGLLSESASFAQRATGAMSNYAQAMAGLASNAQKFRGYIHSRNETVYNSDRQRFNSRADVVDIGRHTDTMGEINRINFYNGDNSSGLRWGAVGVPYRQSGIDPTNYITINHR